MTFTEWLKRKDENLYGVYCGPGPKLARPACDTLAQGDKMPSPIDNLDKACKVHDIEYCKADADWRAALPFSASKTPETIAADRKMIRSVRDMASAGELSPSAKRFASLLRKYFSMVTPRNAFASAANP